ncbi:MAG: phosphoglycerate dehydrogenase [Chloroflexota bacterium]|nr:phosphoglycerate dehydrogenase [Chloroflexota bacterium]
MAELAVLVTCPPMLASAGDWRSRFDALGIEVGLPDVVQQLSAAELIALLPGYDGMIAGDDPLTADVLRSAPRLRVVSKWGIGVDSIDLQAAAELGIRVTNTPDTFGDEVADVAIGYVVMLARQLHRIDRSVRTGTWAKPQGVSLAGRTLGVVGLGSIGRALARRGAAMGMRVIGHDVDPATGRRAIGAGIEVVDLEQLIAQADVISLHCPLTDQNRHMINEARLARMRPGSYLINTARGPLIDEAALVGALGEGRLGGAALEVFEEEPLPAGSPLIGMENVILGSHNASNTAEAVARVNELAIDNVLRGMAEVTR